MNRRSLLLGAAITVIATAGVTKDRSPTATLNRVNIQKLRSKINEDIQQLYFDFLDANLGSSLDEYAFKDLKALAEGYLKDLKEQRMIVVFKTICDASNNPPSLVVTGFPQLDIGWQTSAHAQLGSYDVVSIGPRRTKGSMT